MITSENLTLVSKRAGWVTPATIAMLLFLRIVMLGLGGWLWDTVPDWLSPLYETATYLLTLFLILWERDHLSDYHIGWLAVGIILIFKPLETLILVLWGMRGLPMAFPSVFALIVWAGAAGALAALLFSWPVWSKIKPTDWRWFFRGILLGILTAILVAFPLAAQIRLVGEALPERISFLGNILLPFFGNFLYQLGYAAVSEEPLFRGFLWGYLRKLGWRDGWIWVFQAGLFTLAHIYYLTRAPYSFWIVVPTGALVMGWAAWRSRSIATSMAVHATVNTLGLRFGEVVATWILK